MQRKQNFKGSIPMFLGDILGRAKAKKQYYLFFVLLSLN